MPFPPSQEGLGRPETVAATRGPVPEPPAESQGPPWHPPLPVWLFLLLHVLTFGAYTVFWVGHMAGDLRRHADARTRPWLYVLGFLSLLFQPVVAARFARHLAALNAGSGKKVGPPPWVVVALTLAAIAIVLGPFFLTFEDGRLFAFEDQAFRDLLLFAAVTALIALPWLLLQRQLNVFKAQLQGVVWTAPPHRVTVPQYFALSFGLLFWGVSGLAFKIASFDFDPVPTGVALEAGAEIRGDSGLYALSVAGSGWRRLPGGSIAEDSDLELAGPGSNTRVVVYVNSAEGERLDDFVDYRRRSIRDASDSLEVEEVRELLDGTQLPVSFARYRAESQLFGDFETYWVATIRSDDKVIEVLGWTDSHGTGPAAIEGLVKSLTLPRETPQRSRSANSASTSR